MTERFRDQPGDRDKPGDRAGGTVSEPAGGDNVVRLRGRVSSIPVERVLPSGTTISTFRLSVPRHRTAMTAGSAQTVDWVDCAVWTARVRRGVAGWQVGDQVEVDGSLRRRYYRAGEGSSTRVEVEVFHARRARTRDRPG